MAASSADSTPSSPTCSKKKRTYDEQSKRDAVALLEGVFHAEFSSILLHNHTDDLDKDAWNAVNPPGFKYLCNGMDAVRQKVADSTLPDELYERGFLVEYALSTLENDLNGFTKMLFNGEDELWEVAAKRPKIRRKLDLALAYYQMIDATFTEAFFRSVVPRWQVWEAAGTEVIERSGCHR